MCLYEMGFILQHAGVIDGKPIHIPTAIPATYVKKAETIVSYDHEETFLLVC